MKRYKNLVMILIIFLFLIVGMAQAASAAPVNQVVFTIDSNNYTVNGYVYQMDAKPYIADSRSYVPLRYLANALGVKDEDVIWNAGNESVVLNAAGVTVKLTVDEYDYYISDQKLAMDVCPVIKAGRVYLPARWVAGALGYSVDWDGEAKAVLIGPPGKLPVVLKPLKEERIVSRTEILFPYSGGKNSNVYNAGVAANYINGTVLAPGQQFSYNKVVGVRTTQRGFITGFNIWDEPDVGGGVCRASTAIFQVATKAGFEILERHPHAKPVGYAAPGTDATVSWGIEDLRFVNNSSGAVTIYTRLDKVANGSMLWAELRDVVPREMLEVVLNQQLGHEEIRLKALLKDETHFVSAEQLCQLLAAPYHLEENTGILNVAINLPGQLVSLKEGSAKAYVNGVEFELFQAPFRAVSGHTRFWLPLEDWRRLTGAEVLPINNPLP